MPRRLLNRCMSICREIFAGILTAADATTPSTQLGKDLQVLLGPSWGRICRVLLGQGTICSFLLEVVMASLKSSIQLPGCAWHNFNAFILKHCWTCVWQKTKGKGPLQTSGEVLASTLTTITGPDNAPFQARLEPGLFSRSTFMERLKAPNLSPANESAPAEHQPLAIDRCCLLK